MISETLTLEPEGGAAQTLRDLGVVSARLSRASLSAATLSLTIDPADAVAADLSIWAWESRWLLRRSGEPVFRGRVATQARRLAAAAESVAVELRDLWWDLERIPYTEEWASLQRDGSARPVRTGRAQLGIHRGEGRRATTGEALYQIAAAASQGGAPFAVVGSLPGLVIPPIEAANQSVAQLIRAVMRWHPDASAHIEPLGSLDALRIVVAGATPAVAYSIGERPLATLDIAPRPDLQVDSVHVLYECEAPRSTEHPGEEPDDPPAIRSRPRLVIHEDRAPRGSVPTRRSLMATLQVPSPPDAGGGAPAAPPMPHATAIQTRPLPRDGAYDAEAEKWWLDMLGLSAIGLTRDDIRLPRTASEDPPVQPHRVRFAWQVEDPDAPEGKAPDPVNPESTPLWRPPSVDKLPRMLVSGQIAPWMRVRAAEVIADCHVGVSKAAVEALPPLARQTFMQLGPVEGTVLGAPAYLVYRMVRVVATTAKTRTYRHWPATGTAAPAADTAAAWDRAKEEAVIPGLAGQLLAARRALPWEGTITLSQAEVTAAIHLGHRLSLLHPARPEWATMDARVVRESVDLAGGATTLHFGPPNHLGPQDFAELHGASRRAAAQDTRPLPAPPPPPQEPPEEDPAPGAGGVFVGGTFVPKADLVLPPSGLPAGPRQWELRLAGEGEDLRAEIRAGTLSGLGLSGYLEGMTPDEWGEVELDRSHWLRVEIEVAGSAYSYYVSGDQTETVYIPDRVQSATAELVARPLAETGPAPQAPTVNSSNGAPAAPGVYWFRIGSVRRQGGAVNDYVGPLGLGWCPPDSATLTQLT